MGCGKSTAGKLAAERGGVKFRDLDRVIEEEAGMDIPLIFEKYGENRFRLLEAQCCLALLEKGGIVALGGGAAANAEAVPFIKRAGAVAFIDTPFEVCYERIKNDSGRPIAAQKSENELRELYEYRRRFYLDAATVVIDGGGSLSQIADEIRKML